MFDSPRRRRRRVLIPLLLTGVIAVVVLVVTAGSDARSTIGYLERVQDGSRSLSRAGSTLNDLVADLSRVDRAEFASVVNGVSQALAELGSVAAEDAPTPELVGAITLLRLAVDSWQEGIDGFSAAILAAADDSTDDGVIDDLASSVVLVRAGDRIYDALLDEFAREDVPNPVAEMPEVRLLPVDTPITVLAPAWVSAVRSEASGLPMRASVRIEQVTTDPAWVTSAEGDLVVPSTGDAIDLMVVIGNSGNTDTERGTLHLAFVGEGQEPSERSQPVPVIDAGASTSIVFSDLPVVPGSFYTADLMLVPGGADVFTEDNSFSTGFVVNEATVSTTTSTGG